MDKNTRRHFSTLLDTVPEKFIEELSNCIKKGSNEKVSNLLGIMESKGQGCSLYSVKLYREGEDKSETLLHIAVKYAGKQTISRVIAICPDLLSLARETSENYKGQTPLHIAITRGDTEVTELLLSSSVIELETNKKHRTKLTMINTPATGQIFANTVMMGELPLSVAALTFKTEIVEQLLDHAADIHAQNSYGDTVLHSLVKYAAVYPNKTENVINMFEYLIDWMRNGSAQLSRLRELDSDIFLEEDSYVWFLENSDHLTPLQLSAKLGVVEIFQYIIKLANVYSFVSAHDGLFDVKLYDITEIDTVANQHVASIMTANESYGNRKVSRNIDGVSRTSIKKNADCLTCRVGHFEYPETESILEMMFDYEYDNSSAFRIIETIPVKNIILEKWQKLRFIYFLWGFLHLLLTCCLTAEIVIRSDIYWAKSMKPTNITTDKPLSVPDVSETFADMISWISFITGGVLYGVLILLLAMAKFRRPNALRYTLHNLGYICFLIVFSVCLIVDFIITQASVAHDNIALILAVIAGWWFTVFFLRAIRLFSFFTEMIRRVIIGDLLRFAIIILFMLFAFTAGMYAVFVGKLSTKQQQSASYAGAIDENFKTFGATMMTMFKLMLGLGDIEILSEARIPGLAIALYIVFALLTYVLLLNSLIAMMSQTCAVVLEDRYPQWRLQQLSVILFLEDLFCLPCIKHVMGSPGMEKEIYGFDPVTKQTKKYSRYFFKIHSLQTTYASEEDKEAMKKTTGELDRHRMDETLRSDDTSRNLFSTTRTFTSMRLRPIIRMRNTEMDSPSRQSDHSNEDQSRLKRKKSSRQNKHLSRVLEEEQILNQRAVKLGSEPDLIKSELSPHESRRRRYHSENMHEKENRKSSQSIASLSSEHTRSDGPLTPVELKLHVHDHTSECPENRDRVVPNGYSQHVDIEPYPYSKA